MVSVLASSAVDRGFEPWLGQTKDYQIGIYHFSAKRAALRVTAKIGWLGIRIMCPSGATCLPTDCCFSELSLCKSNFVCWSRTKRTSSSSQILSTLFSVSDYDSYYHFQYGSFYTKVYYLPF